MFYKLNEEAAKKGDDEFVGVCATCSTITECRRLETKSDKEWDWPAAQCPKCGATVYVRLKTKTDSATMKETIEENVRLKQEVARLNAWIEVHRKDAQLSMNHLAQLTNDNHALREKISEMQADKKEDHEQAVKSMVKDARNTSKALLFSCMERALSEGSDMKMTAHQWKLLKDLEKEELPPLPETIEEE